MKKVVAKKEVKNVYVKAVKSTKDYPDFYIKITDMKKFLAGQEKFSKKEESYKLLWVKK